MTQNGKPFPFNRRVVTGHYLTVYFPNHLVNYCNAVATEIRVIDMDIRKERDRELLHPCRLNIENKAQHPEAVVDEQIKAGMKVAALYPFRYCFSPVKIIPGGWISIQRCCNCARLNQVRVVNLY
jgi:hypothetical protein